MESESTSTESWMSSSWFGSFHVLWPLDLSSKVGWQHVYKLHSMVTGLGQDRRFGGGPVQKVSYMYLIILPTIGFTLIWIPSFEFI